MKEIKKDEYFDELLFDVLTPSSVGKQIEEHIQETVGHDIFKGNYIQNNSESIKKILCKTHPLHFRFIYNEMIKIYGLKYSDQDFSTFILNLAQKLEAAHNIYLRNIVLRSKTQSGFTHALCISGTQFLSGANNSALLADYFFGDYFHNLNIYLKSLKEFCKNFKLSISKDLSKQFKTLFEAINLIKTSDDADFTEFQNIFKLLESKNIDYKALMYDCYQNAKLICANAYKQSITPLNSFSCSTLNGVKVYRAADQPYKCFISCLDMSRYTALLINTNTLSDCISASFVSTKSLYSFGDLRHTLTLGYFNIDPKLLLHAFSQDSYTEVSITDQLPNKISKQRFEFLTPEQMLAKCAKTHKYSEFSFAANKLSLLNPFKQDEYDTEGLLGFKNPTPDCVFCLNEPYEKEIEFAKKYNLPIFVSNTKDYIYFGEDDELETKDTFKTNY